MCNYCESDVLERGDLWVSSGGFLPARFAGQDRERALLHARPWVRPLSRCFCSRDDCGVGLSPEIRHQPEQSHPRSDPVDHPSGGRPGDPECSLLAVPRAPGAGGPFRLPLVVLSDVRADQQSADAGHGPLLHCRGSGTVAHANGAAQGSRARHRARLREAIPLVGVRRPRKDTPQRHQDTKQAKDGSFPRAIPGRACRSTLSGSSMKGGSVALIRARERSIPLNPAYPADEVLHNRLLQLSNEVLASL
jgi:hypothetical protein